MLISGSGKTLYERVGVSQVAPEGIQSVDDLSKKVYI
jgi:hypothetical protein